MAVLPKPAIFDTVRTIAFSLPICLVMRFSWIAQISESYALYPYKLGYCTVCISYFLAFRSLAKK